MIGESKASGRRTDIDPVVSFSFAVIMNNSEVARFSGVDGLSYEAEMIEYRDSANPNLPMFRQGRRKPVRVTLKRGMLVGYLAVNDLYAWINEIDTGVVKPRDITIEIGGEESGSAPRAFLLSGCMPSKWSLSSLDGNSNTVLIESLEMVAQYVRRS